LTNIGRLYRKDKRQRQILVTTKPLFNYVRETLKPLTDLRSELTHELRIDYDDFSRLSQLELLLKLSKDEKIKLLRPYYDIKYKQTRDNWKRTCNENNKQIKNLFNEYFKILNSILFTEENEIRLPISHEDNLKNDT